jgi:hypothetical protein
MVFFRFASFLSTRCGLVFALVAGAGCATGGNFSKTQEVRISSTPPGAEVRVGPRSVGTTPVAVELNKQVPHEITVRKTGYHSETYQIGSVDLEEDKWISLGPLRGLAYYRTLETDSLHFDLRHELVPLRPGGHQREAVEDALDLEVYEGRMSLLERVRLQRQVDAVFGRP